MAQVKTADGRRIIFDGTRADAEQFIADNFPRVHVEPGVNGARPDVFLTEGKEGDERYYVNGEWLDKEATGKALDSQTGVTQGSALSLLQQMSPEDRASFLDELRAELAGHDAPAQPAPPADVPPVTEPEPVASDPTPGSDTQGSGEL